MSADDVDMVRHPPHYKHPSGIEAIEICRLLPFTLGNAVKYVWRYPEKNGDEDLDKARWYLLDHLANGFASHPDHKAKSLLLKAAALDNVSDRALLLAYIGHSKLEQVIGVIDWIIGPTD